MPAKVNKSLVPRRWCPVGTKKKEKGRFGVGAGLREAPLAYRPTSSLPNPPGQVKRKRKVGSELGRSFEVRSSIGRRSSGDQSDRVKPRSLIVLHPPVPRSRAVDPTQIGFLRCGAPKEKKKGQVRSWGGASRSSPRSAADPQGIGRAELSPARLSSYVLPPLAAGPSIHLRSGSYAARGLSEWGCPGITRPLSGPTRLTHRA